MSSEIDVTCDVCAETTAISTDVTDTSTDDSDGWRVSFVQNSGQLEVDGVECPEHRVEDALDDLAEQQETLYRSQHKMETMIEKYEPS